MTNKLSKQYNYAEMSVLNMEINGKNKDNFPIQNKDNFPIQVSPKGGMIHFVNARVARDTVWEIYWRGALNTARELEEST